MTAGAEQRRGRRRARDHGVGRPRRPEDELVARRQQCRQRQRPVGGGGGEHVEQAVDRIRGRGRPFVEAEERSAVLDDEVGERSSCVDREAERHRRMRPCQGERRASLGATARGCGCADRLRRRPDAVRRPPASRGAGRVPLVVNVHGGYWQAIYNLIHAGHLCADLARQGLASWNVEYRRLGDPGGEWPAPLDDVVAALDYVRTLATDYPLDLEQVVLMGHSAGGHLALLAARKTTVPLRGVVSVAGVVDPHEIDRIGDDTGSIRRLLGAGPDEEPDRWRQASPRALLPLGFPYVLACGTEDVHWEPNRTPRRPRSAPETTWSCSPRGRGAFRARRSARPGVGDPPRQARRAHGAVGLMTKMSGPGHAGSTRGTRRSSSSPPRRWRARLHVARLERRARVNRRRPVDPELREVGAALLARRGRWGAGGRRPEARGKGERPYTLTSTLTSSGVLSGSQ